MMDAATTPLERARSAAAKAGRLIDLIDTNFHHNGLKFPDHLLAPAALAYLRDRCYTPHPKGELSARQAICDYYRSQGIAVDPERVVIAASASECYSLIFQAITGATDGVALPSPGYPLFEHVARYARMATSFYQMRFEDRFTIDTAAVEAALTPDTRFVVLISPNNPSGQVASSEEVDGLLQLCAQRGLALICDEVFSELLWETGGLPRPMADAAMAGVLVFTINGVSKMFASPDLKLSWIVVSGPAEAAGRAVNAMEIANDMYLNCTPLSQRLLHTLFTAGTGFRRRIYRTVAARRQVLLHAFDGMPGIVLQRPVAGIHAVARLSSGFDDERFAVSLLEQTGVHLHPGYLYGLPDDGFLVLSFLKQEAPLREGLARLDGFLRSGRYQQ